MGTQQRENRVAAGEQQRPGVAGGPTLGAQLAIFPVKPAKDRNFNATSVSVSPRTGSGQSKFCVDCFWIAPELQFAQGLKPQDWPP